MTADDWPTTILLYRDIFSNTSTCTLHLISLALPSVAIKVWSVILIAWELFNWNLAELGLELSDVADHNDWRRSYCVSSSQTCNLVWVTPRIWWLPYYAAQRDFCELLELGPSSFSLQIYACECVCVYGVGVYYPFIWCPEAAYNRLTLMLLFWIICLQLHIRVFLYCL